MPTARIGTVRFMKIYSIFISPSLITSSVSQFRPVSRPLINRFVEGKATCHFLSFTHYIRPCFVASKQSLYTQTFIDPMLLTVTHHTDIYILLLQLGPGLNSFLKIILQICKNRYIMLRTCTHIQVIVILQSCFNRSFDDFLYTYSLTLEPMENCTFLSVNREYGFENHGLRCALESWCLQKDRSFPGRAETSEQTQHVIPLMQQEPSDNQAGKQHSLLFQRRKLMNQTWLHTYVRPLQLSPLSVAHPRLVCLIHPIRAQCPSVRRHSESACEDQFCQFGSKGWMSLCFPTAFASHC